MLWRNAKTVRARSYRAASRALIIIKKPRDYYASQANKNSARFNARWAAKGAITFPCAINKQTKAPPITIPVNRMYQGPPAQYTITKKTREMMIVIGLLKRLNQRVNA
jgi:hypothetical protein